MPCDSRVIPFVSRDVTPHGYDLASSESGAERSGAEQSRAEQPQSPRSQNGQHPHAPPPRCPLWPPQRLVWPRATAVWSWHGGGAARVNSCRSLLKQCTTFAQAFALQSGSRSCSQPPDSALRKLIFPTYLPLRRGCSFADTGAGHKGSLQYVF